MRKYFQKYNLTNEQTQLIKRLDEFLLYNNSQVFLLKGYAGTGKTFITKGLTEYFSLIRRNYILSAPTGKAAKVIQEKTKSEAFTIHKTIYSDKDLKEYKNSDTDRTYKFYFDLRINENSVDTIYIIDEASMISNTYSEMEFFRFGSGFLLDDLMKYINIDQNNHKKKIIFIGDNAQLPPVGMNFSPALNKNYLKERYGLNVDEFELTEVVRQKQESGILQNSINIRKSLENNIFNKLEIDISFDDIKELEYSNFIKKYLQITNNKLDKNTMVIAYTNNSVKDYNQTIRKQFFQNINKINENDKLIIVANNSNYDIFLSNGDFAMVTKILSDTEYKQITLKRKNKETNIVEKIKVDLFFRDIEIIVKDINDIPHLIKCKIIENLLFSDKPNLSSDEHKAIYLDFVMRYPNLKPNTKEFKDTLKTDPYFNALKVKFGYAITCHKAQGSEWKNIFLDCKSHQSYLSKDYFKWLYTALTRSSEQLYIMGNPKIGIFNKIKEKFSNRKTPQAKNNNVKIIINDNDFNIEDNFLLALYQSIKILMSEYKIDIKEIQHYQYQEQYTFIYNSEEIRLAFYYNSKNIITKINEITNNESSNYILKILNNLIQKKIVIPKENNNFQFQEIFLKEFYLSLKNKLEPNIQIIDIGHFDWLEKYTFSMNNETAIINFFITKKDNLKHLL